MVISLSFIQLAVITLCACAPSGRIPAESEADSARLPLSTSTHIQTGATRIPDDERFFLLYSANRQRIKPTLSGDSREGRRSVSRSLLVRRTGRRFSSLVSGKNGSVFAGRILSGLRRLDRETIRKLRLVRRTADSQDGHCGVSLSRVTMALEHGSQADESRRTFFRDNPQGYNQAFAGGYQSGWTRSRRLETTKGRLFEKHIESVMGSRCVDGQCDNIQASGRRLKGSGL